MKNTWLEISLGSLTSLFPDFHGMCLSSQEKLRHISWVKRAIVRFLHKSLKNQEENSGWQVGEMESCFSPAVFVCSPWLCLEWWPLSWQRFLSPPSCSEQMCRDGSAMMPSPGLIPFLGWSAGMPPRKAGEEAQEDLKPKVWAELLGLKLCWYHSKWSVTQLKQTELGWHWRD